jgi:hypothetical protein
MSVPKSYTEELGGRFDKFFARGGKWVTATPDGSGDFGMFDTGGGRGLAMGF